MNTETSDQEDRLHREADFHDEWAASADVTKIRVREMFEAPTALENQWILQRMGNLKGRRLLDIGCGLGESSVYFALCGATVTATDLSPGMVETAQRLAQHHQVELEAIVTPAESLAGIPDDAFDLVYIANTIHHVTDKDKLWQEIRRVLKPGGQFFSWDPVAYNPAINLYRKMAMGVRTEDERPLGLADVKECSGYFSRVESRHFWMAALSLFAKYYFVDRVNPNQVRYWKHIFEPQPLWWWRPLAGLDRLFCRVPGLRWLSWNVVLTGEKLV